MPSEASFHNLSPSRRPAGILEIHPHVYLKFFPSILDIPSSQCALLVLYFSILSGRGRNNIAAQTPPAGAGRSAAATVVSGLLSPPRLLLHDDGLARLLDDISCWSVV